ncbi:exostosin-like glycosyltransferase [Dorcoceras hygrometricum]|uniref:Exostosin-like glycosyltransferase n=1 Tax=Dorcoceras hygrometricum TaxID=472368 RepID=A0A2Z7AFE8_9LAMI|nr:exostosin-like glycosyltransferase [Dorcoceras hygrometricum]
MQRLPAATSTIKTTTYVSHATVTIYIKFHQLQATVPLTLVDYQDLIRLIQYLEKFENSNSYSQGTAQPIEASQPSPATEITVETPWNSNLYQESLTQKRTTPKERSARFLQNLRTPAASLSIPQVVLQSLMGNNRKSKPQGVQRHPNRRKQRLESTESREEMFG